MMQILNFKCRKDHTSRMSARLATAMAQLEKTGLDEVIREAVRRKIPFLGICLGLQLLFEKSDEALGVKRPWGFKRGSEEDSGKKRIEDSSYGMEFSAFCA